MGYLGLALTTLATEWLGGGHALNIWADLNIDISSRLSSQVGFELGVGDPKQVGRGFSPGYTPGIDRQDYTLGLALYLKEHPLLRRVREISTDTRKKHEKFKLCKCKLVRHQGKVGRTGRPSYRSIDLNTQNPKLFLLGEKNEL